MMSEPGYVRLNDPVAYGDPDESDEKLLERARENLTIEGLDEKYLDIEVEDIEEPGEGVIARVVRLYTLIEDSEENPAPERITNGAVEGEGRHSLEGGPDCGLDDYWSHLTKWSIENVKVYDPEENDG